MCKPVRPRRSTDHLDWVRSHGSLVAACALDAARWATVGSIAISNRALDARAGSRVRSYAQR
jgi:hypothetical protein